MSMSELQIGAGDPLEDPKSGARKYPVVKNKKDAKKVLATGSGVGIDYTKVTFAMQAEWFLNDCQVRKRNPLRTETLRAYKSHIASLNPLIGGMSLEAIGNKMVAAIVTEFSERGLTPRSIAAKVFIIKAIRKSAVNDDGEQLFPITWNSRKIDAPGIDSAKRPTVTAQQVQDAISKADTSRKALYALLAGSGLRIAEALAIKLGPDDKVSTVWLPQDSKLIVRLQLGRNGFVPTKTKAGVREVDLAPELNKYLTDSYLAIPPVRAAETRLFANGLGYYAKYLRKDGIEGGFHTFRRFRTTHIRLNGVPDALVDYWTGHAAGTITEQYTQVAGVIESRKAHAKRAGLGFALPKEPTWSHGGAARGDTPLGPVFGELARPEND